MIDDYYTNLKAKVGMVVNGSINGLIVSGEAGLGKTQLKGNLVLMSNGTWKKVEDIKKGDEVISPNKNGFSYEKVIDIHSRFEPEVYDIIEARRNKNKLYSCAFNHEIPCFKASTPRIRINGKTTEKRTHFMKLTILNARELSLLKNKHISCFTPNLIEYKNNKEPDIDAYTLGVWLGNGSFGNSVLSISQNDIEPMNEIISKYDLLNYYTKKETTCCNYTFPMCGKLSKQLTFLGLYNKKSGDKFIPKECLLAKKEFRIELLAGLIDTDGYIQKKNCIIYTTKSKQLAEDIKNLVFSLGGYSSIRTTTKWIKKLGFKGNYFDVTISFPDNSFLPLRVKRKKERLNGKFAHDPRRICVKAIKREKGDWVYGFSITGESKWYITDNWLVTHNSFNIEKALKEQNKEYEKISGHITPLKFVDVLYKNREKIIFFDDAQSIMNSKLGLDLLKAVMIPTNNNKRIVCYNSSTAKLEVPAKFEFNGKIIVAINKIDYQFQSDMLAVKDRCFVYDLKFDYNKKIEIIEKLSKLEYADLNQEQRQEVMNWIKANTNKSTKLSFRLWFKLCEIKKFYPDLFSSLAQDELKKNKSVEVIIQALSGFRYVDDQVEYFKQQTGKSRATFFRQKLMLDKI